MDSGSAKPGEPRARLRVGAVSYLNTLPLVHGMQRGLGAERIELSFATPAVLADRMLAGELDVALLPVIELARVPDPEIVPGLGIVTEGASRSVLLVSKRPAGEIDSLALDPDSRTSNALCRVLLAKVWGRTPECRAGSRDLGASLAASDAAVRIGDKALFEPRPDTTRCYDLGEVWTRATGLPFVFAAWTARAGTVDRELYRLLHASRREGTRALDAIAASYRWNGAPQPDVAQAYLSDNIRFRLGAAELRAIELFLAAAAELDLIDAAPRLRLALERWTTCHETAAGRGAIPRPSR